MELVAYWNEHPPAHVSLGAMVKRTGGSRSAPAVEREAGVTPSIESLQALAGAFGGQTIREAAP